MAQENIWHLCLQHLERELPAEDINTFIRPLEVVSSKNRTRLVAPNSYVRDHIYPLIIWKESATFLNTLINQGPPSA